MSRRGKRSWSFRIALASAFAAALACAPARDGARATEVSKPAASSKSSRPAEPVPAGNGPDTRCDLAEGADSRIDQPFVAVIRDEATYRALVERIHAKIPPLEERFLPSGLVVAAFLGPKPTPGYKVAIRRDGNTFRIEEQRPKTGEFLAQVITTPFAVAAFPAAPDAPVLLEPGTSIGASLMRQMVRSGKLTISGGIAGTSEVFDLTGSVNVSMFDPLATFLLDLTAASERGQQSFKGALTVVRDRAGAFQGILWDASPLVAAPCKSLAVAGTLDTNLGKLSLRFAPGPCKSSDAFSGKGELEAAYAPKPAAK